MSICTVLDVKAQLNKSALDNSDDAEIQAYIDAVSELIEAQVGPVMTRTLTQDFWPETTARSLVLTTWPVLTITSVVDALSGFDLTSWFVSDASSGVLHPKYPGYFPPVGAGSHIVVTYTAGRASCPSTIRLAALFAVADLWKSQQGHGSRGSLPGEDDPIESTSSGVLPRHVRELLAPYRTAPAFA
jgi:hypothetical protein